MNHKLASLSAELAQVVQQAAYIGEKYEKLKDRSLTKENNLRDEIKKMTVLAEE